MDQEKNKLEGIGMDCPAAFQSDKRKRIARFDGYGKKTGLCGDTIEIFLTVYNGCLESVGYEINGCEYTAACAGTVAVMAEGKTVEQAWEITPDKIFAHLQTLPSDHYHCAELAAGALYLALTDSEKSGQGFQENS